MLCLVPGLLPVFCLLSPFNFIFAQSFSNIKWHVMWTVNQSLTCDLIAGVLPWYDFHNWHGIKFGRSRRTVENREKWRKPVAKSSVVPQCPSWLGIDDDDDGIKNQGSVSLDKWYGRSHHISFPGQFCLWLNPVNLERENNQCCFYFRNPPPTKQVNKTPLEKQSAVSPNIPLDYKTWTPSRRQCGARN